MDAKGFKRSPRGGSNIEVETVYDSDKYMKKCFGFLRCLIWYVDSMFWNYLCRGMYW